VARRQVTNHTHRAGWEEHLTHILSEQQMDIPGGMFPLWAVNTAVLCLGEVVK